jgi:hypothetical protein
MSLKRDYITHKKLDGGPGGWHCPCCNKYGTNRKIKPKARRLVRRVNKQKPIENL